MSASISVSSLDDISLRADRYFAGRCVACGLWPPKHGLHPDCKQILTHCDDCAGQEIAARKASNGKHSTAKFLFMRR